MVIIHHKSVINFFNWKRVNGMSIRLSAHISDGRKVRREQKNAYILCYELGVVHSKGVLPTCVPWFSDEKRRLIYVKANSEPPTLVNITCSCDAWDLSTPGEES